MLCPHCQRQQLPENAQTCPACGASLPPPTAHITVRQQVEQAGPGSQVIGVHVEQMGYSAEEVRALLDDVQRGFAPRPFSGECPYLGLEPFQEGDAARFFGREELVQALLQRLSAACFLVVAGPSGSGKSSLVRAGLLPALRQGALPGSQGWLYATLRPGRRPLQSLGRALAGLCGSLDAADLLEKDAGKDPSLLHRLLDVALGDDPSRRALLFVDQFEELFSQASEIQDAERRAFLDLLTYPAGQSESRLRVVTTLRSDFIAACAPYPRLNDLLNQGFLQVGALTPAGLVQAIARPALEAGLQLDPALVERIVQEMGSQPGSLPLMQFALRDLFEAEITQGKGAALTLPGYLARGGLFAALERHADRAFQSLDASQQSLAQAIFRKLVAPGAGQMDAARTALLEELTPAGSDPVLVRELVHRLADARLVTTAADDGSASSESPQEYHTVRLAHERLLEAWPWLHEIVEKNRKAIALENEIQSDALRWQENPADEDSYLYRGARLAAAQQAYASGQAQLSALAENFLQRGAERELARLEEEQTRQREAKQALEDAGQRLEQQQAQERRRARLWALGLTLVAAAAILLGLLASLGRSKLVSNAQTATYVEGQATLQAQKYVALTQEVIANQQAAATAAAEADYQRSISKARRLASSAASVDDPVLAALLSVEAVQAASPPLVEAVEQLHAALGGLSGQRIYTAGGCATQLSPSADGRWLACLDPGNALLVWQVSAPGSVISAPISLEANNAWIVASPSGARWLAANNISNGLELFDLQGAVQERQPARLAPPQDIMARPAFSPDGNWLASSLDGDVVLWNIEEIAAGSDPQPSKSAPGSENIVEIAFQPDASRLAWIDWNGVVGIWDYQRDEWIDELDGSSDIDELAALAFDPTGRWLAFISSGNLRLADLQATQPLSQSIELASGIPSDMPFFDYSVYWRYSIAFSPDGRWLASAGGQGHVLIWDLSGGSLDDLVAAKPLQVGNMPGLVTQVAFSPDGAWLAGGDNDGMVLALPVRYLQSANRVDPNIDAHLQMFRLFNTSVSSLIAVTGLAFMPDGCTLLSASASGEINALELCSGRGADSNVVGLSLLDISQVAISQNGLRAAAFVTEGGSTQGGVLRIWDLANPQPWMEWYDLPVSLPAPPVIFLSPDGGWLAAWIDEPGRWAGLWRLSQEPPQAARASLLAWAATGEPFSLISIPGLPAPQQVLTGANVHQAKLTDLPEADLRDEFSNMRLPLPFAIEHWKICSSLDGQRVSAFYTGNYDAEDETSRNPALFLLDRSLPGTAWQEISLRDFARSASLSADGRWLVLNYSLDDAVVLDLSHSPPLTSSLETIGEWGALVLSPDGRWLAADTWEMITLLALTGDGLKHQVEVPRTGASSELQFSASGGWLAINEGPVKLSEGKLLWLVDLHQPGSPLNARLLSQQPEVLVRLSFSADERYLAAQLESDGLRVYQLSSLPDGLATSAYRIPFLSDDELNDLRLTPDGSWLVASTGSALWFYPLEMDELIARACQAAGRNLSAQEAQAYLPGEEYRGTCPLP